MEQQASTHPDKTISLAPLSPFMFLSPARQFSFAALGSCHWLPPSTQCGISQCFPMQLLFLPCGISGASPWDNMVFILLRKWFQKFICQLCLELSMVKYSSPDVLHDPGRLCGSRKRWPPWQSAERRAVLGRKWEQLTTGPHVFFPALQTQKLNSLDSAKVKDLH